MSALEVSPHASKSSEKPRAASPGRSHDQEPVHLLAASLLYGVQPRPVGETRVDVAGVKQRVRAANPQLRWFHRINETVVLGMHPADPYLRRNRVAPTENDALPRHGAPGGAHVPLPAQAPSSPGATGPGFASASNGRRASRTRASGARKRHLPDPVPIRQCTPGRQRTSTR